MRLQKTRKVGKSLCQNKVINTPNYWLISDRTLLSLMIQRLGVLMTLFWHSTFPNLLHLYPDLACWPGLFLNLCCWLRLVTRPCFLSSVLAPLLLTWYWPWPGSDSAPGLLTLYSCCPVVVMLCPSDYASKTLHLPAASMLASLHICCQGFPNWISFRQPWHSVPCLPCYLPQGKWDTKCKGSPLDNSASTRCVTHTLS